MGCTAMCRADNVSHPRSIATNIASPIWVPDQLSMSAIANKSQIVTLEATLLLPEPFSKLCRPQDLEIPLSHCRRSSLPLSTLIVTVDPNLLDIYLSIVLAGGDS
jgi:hypothetical protein